MSNRYGGRYAAKFAVSVLSVIIFLGIAEGALRLLWTPPQEDEEFRRLVRSVDSDADCYLFDPVLLWRIDPISDEMYLEKAHAYINSLGIRSAEIPEKNDADEIRILCIGDSVTYGYAVPESATWPFRLENIVQTAFPNIPVRVINAGVPGYASRQCLEWLSSVGVSLKPDVVVFCSGFNDARMFFYSDNELINYGKTMTGWRSILRSSYFYEFLRYLLLKTKRLFPEDKDMRSEKLKRFIEWTALEADFWRMQDHTKHPRYPEYKNAMLNFHQYCRARVRPEEYSANVEQMIELGERRGFDLLLLESPFEKDTLVPYFLSFKMEFPIEIYREQLRKLSAQTGTPCIAIPLLTEKNAANNAEYFFDIVHPNAAGCALIAEKVAASVIPILNKQKKAGEL